jgi:hypothetical protein
VLVLLGALFFGNTTEAARQVGNFVTVILPVISAAEVSKYTSYGAWRVGLICAVSVVMYGVCMWFHAAVFEIRLGMLYGGVGGIFDLLKIYTIGYASLMVLVLGVLLTGKLMNR